MAYNATTLHKMAVEVTRRALANNLSSRTMSNSSSQGKQRYHCEQCLAATLSALQVSTSGHFLQAWAFRMKAGMRFSCFLVSASW